MNKLKSLFVLGAVAVSSLTFVSCEKDKDTQGGSENPNIALDGNGYISTDAEVSTGASLSFKVIATSNSSSKSKLVRLYVTRTANNVSTDVKDTTVSTDNLAVVVNTTASGSNGEEVFKFEVTDKDGKKASTSVTITTGTPFAESDTVYFSNVNGPEKGAFDLITGVSVSTTSTANLGSRDMQNSDAAGVTFTGSWTAKNDTRFVNATGNVLFNYNSASSASASAAYGLGTPAATITNPAVGNVYIANLRGSGEYAAIKITAIEPTAGSGTNKGRIYFVFKK